MQTKFKKIYYYLAEFILSLLTLVLVLLIIAKVTILSPKFVLKTLEKNNYYQELYNTIETEMTYYVDSSGLDDSVVKGITNENLIKNEVEIFINSLYTNKNYEIATDDFKNNLKESIENYLEENNLSGKEEDINLFINKMESIYVDKVIFNNKLSFMTDILVKINKLIITSIVALGFITIIFALISKIICHKFLLPIPLITAALLIFLGNYLVYSSIDVQHFKFWNDLVSKIIKAMINAVSRDTIIVGIILIIVAIILIAIKTFKSKKVKN